MRGTETCGLLTISPERGLAVSMPRDFRLFSAVVTVSWLTLYSSIKLRMLGNSVPSGILVIRRRNSLNSCSLLLFFSILGTLSALFSDTV